MNSYNHKLRKRLSLTNNQMVLLYLIGQIEINSRGAHPKWCDWTKKEIAQYTDLSVSCVEDAFVVFRERGYIESPVDRKYNDSRVRLFGEARNLIINDLM